MAAFPPGHPSEAPASAAQLRDLSAQVQALQANTRRGGYPGAPERFQPRPRRSLAPLLCAGLVALLACALAASLLRPARVVIRVVHDMRTVTVVHLVHDVRVVVATPTALPRSPYAGVSVCTDGGFDQNATVCSRPAASLTMGDLAGARVSYAAKDGGTFADTQLTIVVGEQHPQVGTRGGSVSPLGRIQVGVMLTATRQASRLAGVFDAVGVRARPGSTYLIEVDQGSTNLGVTRVTIAA